MEIKKVSVIGTGTMGAGIVQAFAQAGRQVMMKSRSEASNAKALAKISKSLSKLVEKGKMQQEEMDSILANIIPTTDYNAIADSDLIIEAAVEQMDLKVELFQMLDSICKPETIIATNTSSLSITGIAAALKRDTQVIGMHFFNPAPVMKLVEIIKGQKTSDEVYSAIHNLCVEIGKTPVAVNEAPGFVVNRILIPMVNEAVGILADGVATKEDIDAAMKLGANHPMGPLALADLIGLDVCLAIMEVLHAEFGEDKYRPHPLLRKMVRANLLGRKTSEGFYKY
ncbi:MAG: 3-hydroxybutyryl-CoA dehydrogenase [Bacteroidales bacterium]|jgi:3-hydroxybutyryl-CoA dehydrogenase|nr:3-hydroxybutyryl-CoA dehydrogenase [Bacteroidales bacterium]MBO7257218.1 3-hydroxybutyryl-CoA dehydrogenase [Bacteroidales bacterium]MBO7283658.1 3-hydroxybutyryl-CoA dehydrogenase [Bacteroidales bacterium]MBO7323343.1 3-hydroxybutyryl-CoA dehydrogenase [Bacteroidales bacterium]MBQ5748260.1 3-hydroxybutyryl-CoA dehydrogenase [Bacteroidales bacterium]